MYSIRTFVLSIVRASTRLLGVVASLAVAMQTASAVTLTFDAQTPRTGVTGLEESGYYVTGIGARHYVSSGGSSFCAPACADNGTNHLLAFDAAFDVTPIAGGVFSISRLDIAESHQDMQGYWAQTVRVTGTHVDNSTVSVDLLLDFINDGGGPLQDFQTELLPVAFSDLVSIRIEGIGGASRSGFSLDNIVVSGNPGLDLHTTSAASLQPVPEPSTWMLIMLALVGFSTAARRRMHVESLSARAKRTS